jgi:hypothetical protein
MLKVSQNKLLHLLWLAADDWLLKKTFVNVINKRKMHIGYWWESQKERDH